MVKPMVSARTDAGRLRHNNEDSLLVDFERQLYVVCDGLGGHKAGEVASALACEIIGRAISAGAASLAEAFQAAHEAIQIRSGSDPDCRGMATTVVAARFSGSHFELSWVGDSRAYLLDLGKKSITQLTEDHTFIAETVSSGVLTQAEAERHAMRNLLTQSLGHPVPNVRPGSLKLKLRRDQLLLLCSDGLYSECSDELILEIASSSRFEKLAGQLIKSAKEQGGRDNISCIAIQIDPAASRWRTLFR